MSGSERAPGLPPLAQGPPERDAMEVLGSEPAAGAATSTGDDPEREQARKRLQIRRDFGSHLVSYVVVNAFLILIWAVTGGGYFWPVWILAPWGIGLVLHAWDAFVRRPITEADVDAELHRRQRQGS